MPETAERSTIEEHLRANAARYAPAAGLDPGVELLRLSDRASARLYWYRIGGGSGARTVVVKVPGRPADSTRDAVRDRPRLLEPPPLDTKYAQEYRALRLLEDHFAGLDGTRFGAVPLLGRIEPARALVMGEVDGRPLKSLAPPLARLHPGRPSPLLRRAVENAGAWLREFHGLQPAGTRVRLARREAFIASVHRYCDHLGRRLSRPERFAALASRLATAAGRILPPDVPLGLAHGDFAMRNILVEEAGRVVVLDTTALWRTPIYLDLAKLGLALRLSRVQAYTHGMSFSDVSLERVDRWLFAGYFGDASPPVQPIRLYALLLLLDKWSFERALPRDRPTATVERRILDAWYAREAERLADQLDRPSR